MSPRSSHGNSNSDNAIIIFDWDDTILPSSFVDRANADNLSQLPQQFHNLFREIEQCTEKCLAAAAKYGEVGHLCSFRLIDDTFIDGGSTDLVPWVVPLNPFRLHLIIYRVAC